MGCTIGHMLGASGISVAPRWVKHVWPVPNASDYITSLGIAILSTSVSCKLASRNH
jgi:hypothetical protein